MTDAEARAAGHPATVLVVDDDEAIRRVFGAALRHAGYRTLEATSGSGALDLLRTETVDLALLDLELPGASGIELASHLRSDPANDGMRIMFVSGDGALDSKLAGLDAGANDYLVKPVNLEELLARVAAQLRDRSQWLARLDRQLAARSDLARRIAELDPTIPLDVLERQLLEILSTELELVWLRITSPAAGESTHDDQLSIVGVDAGHRVRIPLRFAGAVVGAVEATVDGRPEQAISTLGDLAPQLGAVVADAVRQQESTEQARYWVDGLVASRGLSAVYQPIVELADGRIIGYEGLTRFVDGTRPDLAFARAAQAGVGTELEIAAIEQLLADAPGLQAGAWLSLNVSATTLLTGRIDALVNASSRPLVLEVTENEHVDDYRGVRERLARMPGVRLAVDDAGAGYASLRHIFELRPDMIKLDRGWIADIDADPVRQALVHGLIGFSGAFDARIVAEGVERREEAATLSELGVPLAQGYLFGHPAPVVEQVTP